MTDGRVLSVVIAAHVNEREREREREREMQFLNDYRVHRAPNFTNFTIEVK